MEKSWNFIIRFLWKPCRYWWQRRILFLRDTCLVEKARIYCLWHSCRRIVFDPWRHLRLLFCPVLLQPMMFIKFVYLLWFLVYLAILFLAFLAFSSHSFPPSITSLSIPCSSLIIIPKYQALMYKFLYPWHSLYSSPAPHLKCSPQH